MTSPGTQVGHFVVLDRLGAGGMGEVFLARDSRLEREVALKMLPAEFAEDADRMARFRSEALALAAINHPNIATVFGFEELGPRRFAIVLERVEGETLRARLRAGALPLTESLRVCACIAEALEAAHKRAVIHRDLKPGNVMLGPGGLVKVLDFGLAKSTRTQTPPAAVSPDAETWLATPRVTPAPTAAVDADALTTSGYSPSGESSGTPGYMSPEQVRAEAQDERTDVFAFGCVLFECLTGHRCFGGGTNHEVMTAVLERDPEWERLPAETPARVRALLIQCLDKNPERRLHSMRDARVEIEEALGIRRASALRSGESLATVPNNLPRQPTTFVGREQAMRDCVALIRSTRLVTVTGVGGSGKTRLALQLAESLLREFPDGVWFVDLAPLSDPERVPQAVATALSLRDEPGSSLTSTLSRHLAGRQALIILDNCEHLLQPCLELATTLLEVAADVRILATSREGLGVRGELTYPVPSLTLPQGGAAGGGEGTEASESVQLFVDRARLVAPEFRLTAENEPIVVEVCRRLDGIPLAIELAAARVRMLSVEQIRAKLHDRFRLLSGGSKAALPRHQTLRAAIQWSYDHLSADEQNMLRALSVFAGGWTLDAAVGVCASERDEFEVLDLLTRLADKSLVVVDRIDGREPRYRYLETVRQYGRDLLLDRDEGDASRRRHRDWFLDFAERAAPRVTGPDQAIWLDRLEVELDNLRAALEWCLEGEPDEQQSLRMAAAVLWLWIVRGYLSEARERLEATIARWPAAEPSAALASVLHGAGNVSFRQDDYAAARRYYESALAVRERIGDSRGIAGSLGSLGNVAQYQGRYAEARSLFERSLAMNREAGHKVWEATNLTCLGNCSRHLGEFAASRSHLDQALALNREIGNRGGEVFSLDGLGCLSLQQRDYAEARAFFEQALTIEREIGSVHEEGVTLAHLGRLASDTGDGALARTYFADALGLFRRLGSRLPAAAILEDLASLLAREAQPERALQLAAAAEAIRHEIGAPMSPAEAEALEGALSPARDSIDEFARAAATHRGGEMTLDQAIELGIRPRA